MVPLSICFKDIDSYIFLYIFLSELVEDIRIHVVYKWLPLS